MREEEEEITVHVEELDNYFLSSLASSTSCPISKHMDIVHEHLNGTFPTDPVVSTQLQKSLLRIAKLANPSIAPRVKEACQYLAVKLETLVCNYKVYEECRFSILKSLNRLTELQAQKEDLGQNTKQ